MGVDWYDREGRPLSLEEAGRLFADFDYKRVDLTEVGPYVVSTVWMGMDHSFMEGPPQIFETMVFTSSEWSDVERIGLQDIDCVRYATESEARAGHQDMVALIRATTIEPEEFLHERNRESDEGAGGSSSSPGGTEAPPSE
jgi:hypothetical protein